MLIRNTIGTLSAAFALVPSAFGQDLTPTAPPQHQTIAIMGTVHTVSGETIEHGMVVFDNGKITAVGEADASEVPSDARVIDAAGAHIYPGVFDAGTILGLTEIEAVRAMRDVNEVGDMTPEVRAAVSLNPDSTLIPVARTNGILTCLVLPSGGLMPGRASIIRTDGWTAEDLTILDDAGLVVNWPRVYRASNTWTGKPSERWGERAEEQIESLTKLFGAARAYQSGTADERVPDVRLDALAPYIASGESQKPLIVNAEGIAEITSAVQWADERDMRVIIRGGRDAVMCAELLKEHHVPVIVVGTHGFPSRSDEAYDAAFTLPARLEQAGVQWCLASSDMDANVRNLPYEAATAVAYGLDPEAAVRSITLAPAEILGMDDMLGSIEVGKAATLIVTTGPLLDITSNVTDAFIDGREVDLANKQTKLRDKYLEKYRQQGLRDHE